MKQSIISSKYFGLSILLLLVCGLIIFGMPAKSPAPGGEPCGNGIIDEGEQCDDGNRTPGDGCDENCQLEPFCGDGVLDVAAGEECDDGNNEDGDGCSADCKIEYGGEGCTPGYWRQPQHLWAWAATGLSPADDFDTTFGVDYFNPDITLGEAVWAKGGGVNKIARHGTAALLNALHPAVAYPWSASEVIAAVQAGDVKALANDNELSDECPANFD